MRTLHIDVTWKQIYDLVTGRQPIGFKANRADIGFENIENEIQRDNYEFPFPLDILGIPSIENILSMDAIADIGLTSINRIRMRVKLLGGQMWYERIGKGDEWRVTITF